MSGGSMDYLSFKVECAQFNDNSILRKAFRIHLKKVANALHAIEWNDSGDGHNDEDELIRNCLFSSDILNVCKDELDVLKKAIEAEQNYLEKINRSIEQKEG